METPDTRSNSRALSTMLEFHEVYRHDWTPQELQEMLHHQLAAPLHLSLGPLSGEVAQEINKAGPAIDPLLTLGQLLHHPRPPVGLLRLVKRFAKLCRSDRENPLPPEIVMLLYYTSITAALVKAKQSISGLTPVALKRGLSWLSSQSWVDEQTRSLLKEGLNYVAEALSLAIPLPPAEPDH
jgi:hypothetical protein